MTTKVPTDMLADVTSKILTTSSATDEGDVVQLDSDGKIRPALLTTGTLAQGDVLYYDGSDLVNLGAGTSGQFLKTQGADANPVWATAGGGAMEFISKNTIGSSVSELVVNFDETEYNNYILRIEGLHGVSDGNFQMRWSNDDGTTFSDQNYGFMQGGGRGGSTFDTGQNASSYGLLTPTAWNDAGAKLSATLNFTVTSGDDNNEVAYWWTGYCCQTSSNYQSMVTGAIAVVAADYNTAFELSNSGGNIDEGVVILYGLKES